MATLKMKEVVDFLQAVEDTGLSLPVLRRHIERVGEKGVCDSQLTELHRSGLDSDLLEAAKKGTLHSVDRTIFRHLLGLEPSLKDGTWPGFRTWKTIKLGLHRSPKDYRKAIKSAGMEISGWGNDILNKTTCFQEEVEVDLVVLSVAELGFEDGATYRNICARASELGLNLCPNELGPALREQYPDQPRGEWLIVAMDAVSDSDGYLRLFRVGHDGRGRRDLFGVNGYPGCFWRADRRVVFLRRK